MIRQKEPRWWQKEADWWRKRTRLMTKKNQPGGKKKGPGYKKKVTWWQRWVKVGQVFSLRNDNDNVDCQKMGPKLERLFILACRSMLGWVITACIELMNEKQYQPFMTQWPWPCVRTNNHFVSCYKGDDIVWPRLVATITKKASSLASLLSGQHCIGWHWHTYAPAKRWHGQNLFSLGSTMMRSWWRLPISKTTMNKGTKSNV